MFRLATVVAAVMALLALVPGVASARPGGEPSSGSGYYESNSSGSAIPLRRGLILGFGLGIGDMSADSGPIDCIGCSYNPLAGAFDFHIGGMLNPRLALLFELWGALKTLDASGTESLVQTMAMVAAQYWLAPRLWIKGGLGAAHLSYSYDDGYSDPIDDGLGAMGAVGYEILISPRFAIDLQLRLGTGSYEGIAEQIHVGTAGVGFNWY